MHLSLLALRFQAPSVVSFFSCIEPCSPGGVRWHPSSWKFSRMQNILILVCSFPRMPQLETAVTIRLDSGDFFSVLTKAMLRSGGGPLRDPPTPPERLLRVLRLRDARVFFTEPR